MRRSLAYVAFVWGALTIVLTLLNVFTAFAGTVNDVQLFWLVLAVPLVVGGRREIESQHVQRVRYLPWLVGFHVAAVIVAMPFTPVWYYLPHNARPPQVSGPIPVLRVRAEPVGEEAAS
ncbi:MAG TPA: hypothetical protein VGH79_00625 [Gaiellaceae bacterium]